MDAPLLPLVLPKLRLPAARQRIIHRARLIDLLDSAGDLELVLVCAPAGYGKSTLLAEWALSLKQNGTAVAWYALDSGDDAPIAFVSYLIASFIQALGPQTELVQIAQLLRSSTELDFQRFLPAIINGVLASDKDCVLMLDDYHQLGDPLIHNMIAYLLEHLPENLRIVISSRSKPPLPLARLRARGQLLEIRASDLRFTIDETSLFLNDTMRLELSPMVVNELENRTEGWVAGLQLAALSLSSQKDREQRIAREELISTEDFASAFTGGHRYLVEYLLEEVVDRLPEEVQSFLLSTSILERMCAPLCDAILNAGIPGDAIRNRLYSSEAILEQLEQANLFIIPLDDQGYWYRYHHLFRDFLLIQLKKVQPERVTSLHRAACEWLAGQSFLREAARHAFQIKDWAYAAAFVEQHSFTMMIHSEISTIHEWCSAFPEEVMRTHPQLCLHQCWAWVFSFRSQNRARVEARLQQVDQVVAGLEDRKFTEELTEQAAIIRTFLAMAPDSTADPHQQIAISQKMLSNYSEEDPGQFSAMLTTGYAYLALQDGQAAYQAFDKARQMAQRGGLYFGVVEATFHLARLAHSLGQLRHATEICREGQARIAAMLPHAEQELPALGCLDVVLGEVFLEQDLLVESEQHLRHGLELMGWGMNPYYMITAYVAMFRLLEIQRRSTEALQYLDRLEITWPDIAFCIRGLRAVHALRSASDDPRALAEASEWCRDFSPQARAHSPGMGPFGAAEVYYLADLAWIEAKILTGNGATARLYLEQLLALAETNGLKNRVIELSLLQVELEADTGQVNNNQTRALSALERALSFGQPEGYIRIFDRGPALTHILVKASNRGIFPEYVSRILAAIKRENQITIPGAAHRVSQPQERVITEQLSERELEVLRLIARGASNQSISDQLVISIGTVKSHINHILGKLDAHSRTEAVARARDAGLI